MARIGWVACGVCGNPEASVTENATGTLSVSCHKCQFSGYGKAGSKAARTIRGNLTPDDDAPTAPAPIQAAPVDAPKPKTAPKAKPSNLFDLGAA